MQEILEKLSQLQVKLWVNGDQLCYSAPPGVMDETRRAELIKYKPKIIAYLKKISQEGNVHSGIAPIARPAKIPLSYAQELPWREDQLTPGNTANNMFLAFRLYGSLDPKALEWGFQQIVARHEILHTVFKVADGQPYQEILSGFSVSIPVVDVSSLPQGEIENLAQEEARRPFDLSSGPLVRCSLLYLTKTTHILLLTIHHIVSDGWSVEVLFQELILFSRRYVAGQTDPLPSLPLQYADFAIQQRNLLQGEMLVAQIAYWKKQLAGIPLCLDMPTDRKRPAVHAHRGARLPLTLPRKLTDDLKELSRVEGVTLFMTLLAAFQVLLARWSGQTDVYIGSPVVNRKQPELEQLIGFFANTLVLRTDCAGNPTFRQIVRRVQDVCLEAYDHQDVPFGKLLDELKIPEDPGYTPLFQVMFNVQNTSINGLNLPDLSVEPMDVDRNTTHFDLRISLQGTSHGLSGFIKYNIDLFDQQTILLLIAFYGDILEGWVCNPDQPISDIHIPEALQVRVKAAKRNKDVE
jgi:hypothetical protein